MPIPGQRVFQAVQAAQEQARAAAERVRGAEQQLKSEVEKLVSDRGAALLELAQHDLPDLKRDTIQSTFNEIQKDLLLIAQRKEQAISELQGRVQRLLATEQESVRSRTQVDARLAQQSAEQARLQAVLQTALQTHAEFPALSKQAVDAEAALLRDEKRVADVQTGASEKLPTYERSSLFQYLYRRRYLTPEYTARGWTRRMDRWVADMIGYPTAQRGYDFLKNTPARMQAELMRRREVFHQLMSQVEAIQKQVADQVGLPPIMTTVTSDQKQRDRLDQQLAETRRLITKVQSDLATTSQDQCQFYHQALDRYRAFLETTETAVLEQRAARTPDPRDDEIVSRLQFLTSQISTLKPRLQSTAQEATTSLGVTDGFEFIARRIEQSNFEQENSHFDDQLPLDQLLDRFRQGVLSRDALWTEIKQHQEFVHTEAELAVANIVNLANHPMTHVLAQAMVQVVGAALQQGVNRSIQRRSGPLSPNWPGVGSTGPAFPEIQPPTWVRTNAPAAATPAPPASPRPSSGGGEYTTVDRF